MEPEFSNALGDIKKRLRPFMRELVELREQQNKRPRDLVLKVTLGYRGKKRPAFKSIWPIQVDTIDK